jgi:hypothetical protein
MMQGLHHQYQQLAHQALLLQQGLLVVPQLGLGARGLWPEGLLEQQVCCQHDQLLGDDLT